MTDYQDRLHAVEDATRLVRALHAPEDRDSRAAFTSVSISRPPLELFDVLEVARFLLDIEEDSPAAAAPGSLPEESP